MKTVMTSVLVALGLTAFSGSAKADDSKFFAETQFAGSTAGALSYQVIPNLYVGLGLGVGFSSATQNVANVGAMGAKNSAIALSPQVGYALKLSDSLVLWPRIAYTWTTATQTPIAAGEAKTDTAVTANFSSLDVSVPLFVKAGGLHFGPSLDYTMAVGSSTTTGTTTVKGDGSQSAFGLSFRAGLAF